MDCHLLILIQQLKLQMTQTQFNQRIKIYFQQTQKFFLYNIYTKSGHPLSSNSNFCPSNFCQSYACAFYVNTGMTLLLNLVDLLRLPTISGDDSGGGAQVVERRWCSQSLV